jgi:hypothetical protein
MRQDQPASRLDRLYAFFDRLAAWPILALLVIALVFGLQAFTARSAALHYVKVLDVRSFYTPSDVQQLMQALGPQGRNLYAITEVTLDLLFPFVYGGLLALLLVRLYDCRTARSLVVIPVIAIVFDLLENLSAFTLSLTYSGQPSPLAWAGAAFTLIKYVAGLASLAIVSWGALRGTWLLFRPRHSATMP